MSYHVTRVLRGVCFAIAVIASALLCSAVGAGAQTTGAIHGVVVDESGGAIAGAHLMVESGVVHHAVASDARGAFEVPDLPAGPCTVRAELEFFEPAVMTVDVSDHLAEVRLTLRAAGLRENVVVTATRTATETADLPAAVSVVSSRTIEARNVARLGDALTLVPSLFLGAPANGQVYAGTGGGGFSLRGLNQQRTLILLDGQPLQDAAGGNTNFRIPFMPEVSRIEVVPGAFSSLYGSSAIGGVINVITKRPDTRGGAGSVKRGFGDASATSESLYYQDAVGRFGLAAGAGYDDHRSYLTEFVTRSPVAGAPGIPVFGSTATTTREGLPAFIVGDKNRSPWTERHATLRGTYRAASATRLSGGLGYSDSNTTYTTFRSYLRDAAGQPVSTGTLGIDGQRITLTESNFVTAAPLTESSLRVFGTVETLVGRRVPVVASVSRIGRGLSNNTVGAASSWNGGVGTQTDQPNSNVDASVVGTWPVGRGLVTGIGMHRDALNRRTYALSNWRDISTRTATTNGADAGSTTTSLFGQQAVAAGRRLTLYLGGRIDRWDTHGTYFQTTAPVTDISYPARTVTSISPKVSGVFRPVEALTIRGSVGRSFRAPTNIDLYSTTVIPASQSTTGFLTTEADANLQPERGTGLELGVEWRVTPTQKIVATYYETRLTSLIYTKNVSSALTQRINAGAANVRGVEFSVERRLAAWLRVSANAARIGSTLVSNDADPLSVGKRLTASPRNLAGADVVVQARRFTGTFAVSHVGQAFVLAQNTDVLQGVPGSTDAYTVVNSKIGYRCLGALTTNLAVNNVTNRIYNQFYRMPARNATLELAFSF